MPLFVKRLLLLAAAILISLASLEVGIRCAVDRAALADRLLHTAGDTDGAPRAQALEDQRIILHPYFGYVVDPRSPGINRFGFFHDEPIMTRAPDRFIIAFFGGSVADQVYSLGHDALVEALRAAPAFAGKRIEVVSTALGGYKQPQQLLVLADLLAQGAQFDVVVALDGFNEVDGAADNVQDGVNPYYPLNWQLHARSALDSQSMALMGQVEGTRAARATLRDTFARSGLTNSALALWVWDVLDRRQTAALRAQMLALEAAQAQAEKSPQVSGPPLTFADEDAMYADFVEVWARASFAMRNLCRGQGIRFLQFLQPNQYFAGSKTLTDEERRIAWSADVADAGRVAHGYPLLVVRGRELAAQGVDFHDLSMLFRDERDTLYSDTCCHYNQRGADLIARAIAAAIVERTQ